MNALTDTLAELPGWRALGLAAIAERAAVATLAYARLDPEDFEISVLGCDDATIARLNAEFRAQAIATNVLSWPSADRAAKIRGVTPTAPDPGELGNIAIAYGTCQREAGAEGVELADHTTHLIVHAVLHLLGYDHQDDDDAALMDGATSAILATMGIANPYV